MKRLLCVLAWCLILASPAFAEEVVLSREAPLFERPQADAVVKATLPAGMKLDLLTEQGDWLAVSSGSLSGWIRKADAGGAGAANEEGEDADELIRSIRDIVAEEDTVAVPSPPPSPRPARTGEPEEGTEPSGGEGLTPPPPPAVRPDRSLPPPPPARPPSQRGKSTYGPTSPWGGFYNSRGWYRVTANLREDETGGAFDMALGMGPPVKLGFVIGGATLDGKQPPRFSEIADAVEEDSGGWTTLDRFENVEDAFSAVDFGMYLDVFFAHPGPGRPVGVYAGVFFAYRQFFGLDDAYDGELDDLTRQRIGGELGIFHATLGSPRLIGRASYRLMRETYLAGDATVDDTVGEFTAGMELQMGSFVPGLFAGRTSGDETTLTFSLTLAPGGNP